jgi:hypothetical protein
MENIKIIEVETFAGVEVHVHIDHGNGEFTDMLKSRWDELQAAKENGTIS